MTQIAGVIVNVFGAPVKAAGNRSGLFLTLLVGFIGVTLLAGAVAVVLPLIAAATAFVLALVALAWPIAITSAALAVGVGVPLAAHKGLQIAQLNSETMGRHELLMALAAQRPGWRKAPAIERAPVYVASARTGELEAVTRW